MEIDAALERAKPLGRTQAAVLTTSSFFTVEIAWLILSVVFIAETPLHHCDVGTNTTLPETEDNVYESCEEFVDPEWKNETMACSDGWYYDTELYGHSIVSEWDLVCDKDSLAGLSQSIMLAGFALGAIITGTIADKYGRRLITIVSLVIFNILGIAVSFSPNYATFVTLRFFLGIFSRAIQLPTLILLFEYLLPKHRATVGNAPGVLFTLGLMVMSGLAYWIRDWRQFHALMMTPTILAMTFIWLQPESVRWLLSQGKYEEAEKWMQKCAKFNGVKDFPSPALKLANRNLEETEGDSKDKKKGGSITQLFKPPTLVATLIISWLWITYALVYFGFALTTGTLAGDPYLNFFLSSLVELPARILPLFIIERFGRLIPLISILLSAGVCMIAIIVVPIDVAGGWLLSSLALLGKFLTVCSYAAITLVTSELFPTTLRLAGMGFAQLIGNLGSIASPILIYLDKFVPDLSFMIMTASAFLAAFLCLYLPETKNTVQPETPEDLQILFDSKTLFSRLRKTQPPHDDVSISTNQSKMEEKLEENMTNEEGPNENTMNGINDEHINEGGGGGGENAGFEEDTNM
ncbi:organic anion transporter 3-like [Apostichopus japonicus]|uniref:organic anion transporter 3-like n=1 Tax=Stichopus japonicus TaxID=307972 RepID=UPI003AB66269